MTMFFSAGTGGFYDSSIHAAMPDDARAIDREHHADLLRLQGEGCIIAPNAQGLPVAIAPPPPTAEQRLAALRERRDKLLQGSDYTQMPDLPISADRRAAWATYRQALRDLPSLIDYLDEIEWPIPPEQ